MSKRSPIPKRRRPVPPTVENRPRQTAPRCLLCGGRPEGVGLFVPGGPSRTILGAAAVSYRACARCSARPGFIDAVERVLLRRALGVRPGEGRAMVLCTRIGRAAFVPAGYETTDCTSCRAAVWISPDVIGLIGRLGLEVAPFCNVCAGGSP